MQFPTQYKHKATKSSEKGSPIKPVYQAYIDENGSQELKQVGEHDLQAEIDSFEESVNLDNILMRYGAGDISALNKIEGFYADVTDLPVNLQEVMNLNLKGQQLFAELPSEVREIFNNNYMDFMLNPDKFEQYMQENSVTDLEQEKVVNDDDEE